MSSHLTYPISFVFVSDNKKRSSSWYFLSVKGYMLHDIVVFTAIDHRKVIDSALLHYKVGQKRNRAIFNKTVIFRDTSACVTRSRAMPQLHLLIKVLIGSLDCLCPL